MSAWRDKQTKKLNFIDAVFVLAKEGRGPFSALGGKV